MWLVILLFLLLYWLLYSPYYSFNTTVHKTVEDSLLSSLPPSRAPPPYTYFFGPKENDQLTLSASYGGAWTFSIGDHYIFDRHRISEADDCLGKPNGFMLNARGKTLYDAMLKKKLPNDALEYRRNFYFLCDHDAVRQIFACPPGTSFRNSDCHAIESCIDRENGFVIADPTDREHYRVCLDGKPVRKRCQPDTFFWKDTCRSLDSEMCESEIFVIHKKKYIRCGEEENRHRGVVEECPENTSILGSWKSCERDDCVGIPDEFRKPMTSITRGPFMYSPGYHVCRENRIVETVTCPTEWNAGHSRGDDLTRLPTVFDAKRQACRVPSFCENVFSAPGTEAIVPVHEFTKHVPKWSHAAFFDSVAGYRCATEGGENKKARFALEPGKRIIDNAVVSACEGQASRTKIPIADRTDAFYDCESQKVIECSGSDSLFDGEQCRKPIKHAHSYKNVSFFRLTGLSHRNDWLEPFPPRNNSSTCLEEGVAYFPDYDVCLVPECSAYPFLKQIPKGLYIFLLDHICMYDTNSNTIKRKRHFFGSDRKLDFWNQRSIPKTDPESDCVFGQNLESGNFFLDSTLYVTCNLNQPFVFCPSASTRGIALGPDDTYACLSRDSSYEIQVDANTTITCLTEQIDYFQIEEQSHYLVNGKKELGTEIRHPSTGLRNVSVLLAWEEKYTFWSDCPYVVWYRKLPTYPPNVHLEKNSLVSGTLSSSKNWLIPVKLPNHTVEESIETKFY